MGEFLGQAIIFFYILTILKYVFKMVTKLYGKKLAEYKDFYVIYKKVMLFIMKHHNKFGFLTVAFLIAHFLIQFSDRGLNITGALAASVMAFQVLLGIYGTKVKKRSKIWLLMHRGIAVVILIAILIHTA